MNVTDYLKARDEQVKKNWSDDLLWLNVYGFTQELIRTNYVKNFTWMGRPILQYPTDLMVMQEIIWEVKPDIIIETGVAFGGMTKFYAHMLDVCGGTAVIGIDIDIRKDNRKALMDQKQLAYMIKLVEGSSIDPNVFEKVLHLIDDEEPIAEGIAEDYTILVSLDSNHSHDHVLQELKLYSPLVSVGSYVVVFDTAIEIYMKEQPKDRPWGPKNNPMSAVQSFMKDNENFIIDHEVEARALITAAPSGWLRRVK